MLRAGDSVVTLNNAAGAWHVKMPLKYSAPGEIRTPDPQVRSLMLYPTELRAHLENKHVIDNEPVRATAFIGWCIA
jgi:hypothetical protein